MVLVVSEPPEFSRIVGRRRPPPVAVVPSPEVRAALTRMASYRTAAPKGVFRYASHEAANQDREAWTIAKALELRGDARACGAAGACAADAAETEDAP